LAARSASFGPYRIWRVVSALLLFWLPMSSVPKLPGEFPLVGNRLISLIPSLPAVQAPVVGLYVQSSGPLPLIAAFQVSIRTVNGSSLQVVAPDPVILNPLIPSS